MVNIHHKFITQVK